MTFDLLITEIINPLKKQNVVFEMLSSVIITEIDYNIYLAVISDRED